MTIGPIKTGMSGINLHMPSVSTSGQTEKVNVGQQVRQALFGRPKPPAVDPAKFPQLAESMRKLYRIKAKCAHLAGDDEDEYDLYLADSTIAAIDQDGNIAVGYKFLMQFMDNDEILAGVIAHEVGHRPKRWKAYQSNSTMTQSEIEELCRFEETRADMFAGKALAEFGLSYDGIARFLLAVQPEDQPHKGYHPATIRARIIKEAFDAHQNRVGIRKRIFPDVERLHSSSGYIGKA